MAGIGEYRYEGWSLEDKHAWMQAGMGSGGAIRYGDALQALANRFEVSDGSIGWHVVERRLGDGWRGTAATAAAGAFDRAATAITRLAGSGQSGGAGSHRYGDSFGAVRNAIPAPVVVGENSWLGRRADELGATLDAGFGSTFGVQSDYTARLAAHREADRAANDALKRHEAATRAALAAFTVTDGEPASAGAPSGGAPGTPAGHPPGVAPPGSGGGTTPAAGALPGVAAPGGTDGAIPGGAGGAAEQPAEPSTTSAATATPGPAPGGGDPGWVAGGEPSRAPGPHPGLVPTPVGGGWPGPPRAGDGPGGWSAAPRPGGNAGPTGHPAGPGPREHPPRLPPPRGGPVTGETGPSAGAAGRSAPFGRPPGLGMVPPLGLGAAGPGGERSHRVQIFIPDDEPFRVEPADVAPPVLGVPEADHG